MKFNNRQDAGMQLVSKLEQYSNNPETIVIGLPRGGVVTGATIAEQLNLPLDIVVPRKISAPDNPELAIGAITLQGDAIFDQNIIDLHTISEGYIKTETAKEKTEAQRREQTYRPERTELDLSAKTVILVDDGIATGATMLAAINAVKKHEPAQVIVAVPVLPKDMISQIESEVDQIVYLDAPWLFGAVGDFYQQFKQTSDAEVIELMSNPALKPKG